ncbi:MAG: hypothetical protein PWP37_180, partial [Thermotogota bacterium]|nr:hypothetical protein [Thermotogota bacterium]
NDRYQKDSTSCFSFLLAASMRLGDRLYECLLGATQDCRSSILEQEEVKRQHLAASMWLGNCLHKRSLGASQDLETEMCDKGRKAKNTQRS